MTHRFRLGFLVMAIAVSIATLAAAAEPVLTIDIGGVTRKLTRDELLKNPAITEIDVPRDVAYKRAMHFRAVPLDRLLAGLDVPRDQVLEAIATDGFVGSLPVDLVLHPRPDGARAYLAIETPEAPWPGLSGKPESAGPFYVVWLKPEASGVRSEQWPFRLATIRGADSPAKRWPALGVDRALPADDPVRVGQTLFVTQCLVCHKLNGAGSADLGPDLNTPENPTEYFQADALKRYIRDPASLRHWPAMQMPSFDKDVLSDREIDLVIAYLHHMAGRKAKP
jgi:mono/diheme cytochrome c family protein